MKPPTLILLLLTAAPALAQYGAPLYGPTVTDPNSNSGATIIRARDQRRSAQQDAATAKKRAGSISAGEPEVEETPAPSPSSPPPQLDKPLNNEISNPTKPIFTDFAILKKKAEEAAAANAPPPPPPAAPEGLRGVSLQGLVDNDEVLALMAKAKRDDVRKLLDRLVADKQVLDEGAMVDRVARALGAMAPGGAGEVEQVAHPVPLEVATTGDVLLFDLKGRKHVAVFYGGGRFAWSGRAGVSFASLDRLPWPAKLVAVLRMPSL